MATLHQFHVGDFPSALGGVNPSVSLGTVKVDAPGSSVSVSASAISYGPAPELEGRIRNVGSALKTHLTIEIRKSGTAGGDVLPRITGLRIGAWLVNVPVTTTTRISASLGGAHAPPAFQDGGAQALAIDLEQPKGRVPRDYEVSFSWGRDRGRRLHTSCEDLEFSKTSSSKSCRLSLLGATGVVVRCRNSRADGRKLVSVQGSLSSSRKDQPRVISVGLSDAKGVALDTAKVTLRGATSFTITGLRLGARQEFDVWIRMRATAHGGRDARLKLVAGYE